MNNMNSVAILLMLLLAVTWAEIDPRIVQQRREMVQKALMECGTNGGPEELTKWMDNVPRTRTDQCHLACMLRRFKLQSANGQMNMDTAMEMIAVFREPSPEVYHALKRLFKKCIPITEYLSDHCEIAGKFAVCISESANKLGLVNAVLDQDKQKLYMEQTNISLPHYY